MRESDLLAFEIGVEKGHPAAVMCSYNRVNGDFFAFFRNHTLEDSLGSYEQFRNYSEIFTRPVALQFAS